MKKILLAVALLGLGITTELVTTTNVYAQTDGMQRRGERRDNRQDARTEKHECKAGEEDSRSECRQQKRDTKQQGRGPDDDNGRDSDAESEQK